MKDKNSVVTFITVGIIWIFDPKRLASCEDSVFIYEKDYIENTIEDIKKDLRAKSFTNDSYG